MQVEEKPVATAESLDTLEEKVSYIIGYDIARNTQGFDFELDSDILTQAMADKYADRESLIPEEDMRNVMNEFQTVQRERSQAKRELALKENESKGKTFLDENAAKEGVQTTESGLQYKVLEAGDGAKPAATDQVKVHYRGRLLDGTEFDSSYKRGQPATFKVNQLIPGWVEALQLMPTGSKWELYIPASLGYGQGGTGNIPPNSTLIFEMELLEIVAAEAKPETPAKQ